MKSRVHMAISGRHEGAFTAAKLTSAKRNPRSAPVRAGDAVVALGYPLVGLRASTANLTVGNVSALAGLGDDSALSPDQRARTTRQ